MRGLINSIIQEHKSRILLSYETKIGPQCEKTCLLQFANNRDADQPDHLRSLISAFVIHFLEVNISKLAIDEVSIF